MPAVNCKVRRVDLENEEGIMVPGLEVECTKCGHTTESFGQRGRSLRRCLALMGETCPDEDNFYTTEETTND